ncbi:MAG: NAD(P)/FAD-dependent oxidoreductase [Peptococcaceae bacterium]|nr:NAD(P)/FAD-dependent oxidoreductase [Peptococcaceae bacterium]
MKHYDMIVIGTGAGNIVLEAAQLAGKRCAQIERGKFGGTCLTRGCIPTKVLVTAADRLYELREADHLGIHAGEVTFDWQRVRERVWHKIDDSISLRQFYLDEPHTDVYEGTAHFTDNHTIEVHYPDGTVSEAMTADKIYIATGGKTKLPAMDGLADVPYYTSERFFSEDYPDAPFGDVIVIGGGAIGCEFAHIFRAFGARVQLVQHNVRLLPKSDAACSAACLKNLEGDGITVYFNKETPAVRQENGQIILTMEDRAGGHLTDIHAETLFICPGIVPATDGLGLENTDISLDGRGWIRTNEFLETSVDGVYALGDINGRQQFRHKANYEADILAYNHYKSTSPVDKRWARYDLVPAVTFTHPEVADVGLTEADALARGHRIRIGTNPYAATAKGYALGYDPEDSDLAFAKLIIDAETNDILGVHAVGPFASTLIQPFLNLMNAGQTPLVPLNEDIASKETKHLRAIDLSRTLDPHKAQTVRETMVPHPSLSEVGIWTYYPLEEES